MFLNERSCTVLTQTKIAVIAVGRHIRTLCKLVQIKQGNFYHKTVNEGSGHMYTDQKLI